LRADDLEVARPLDAQTRKMASKPVKFCAKLDHFIARSLS
jgi:hypothetical protein